MEKLEMSNFSYKKDDIIICKIAKGVNVDNIKPALKKAFPKNIVLILPSGWSIEKIDKSALKRILEKIKIN